MNTKDSNPDLGQLAAQQIAVLLDSVPVGSRLLLDSSSDLCFTLELLVPALLSRTYFEWENESIDGFFISTAVRTGADSAEVLGTCILIGDQTVTPFALDVTLSDSISFRDFRVRVGEPGGGALGISGPGCTSPAARDLLDGLSAASRDVEWVYDITI